jgi:cytochrome P450
METDVRPRSATGSEPSSPHNREPDTVASEDDTGDWDPNIAWQPIVADQVPDASFAYAETRSRYPVARVDGILGGFWAVLRHDLLVEAALDTARFSNLVPFFNTRRPPLECDPPEHRVYRRLLNPYFSRERMAALEEPLHRYAGEMLAPLVEAGGGDFAERFSRPFPTRALCLLLEVPDDERRLIDDWSRRVDEIGGQTPPGSAERVAVGEELRPWMTALIEDRRRKPGDDVVSALVRGDPELPPLDDEMVVGIVMMFISAGHNTTTSAIGNAVLRLARDGELQSRLRAGPGSVPAFAEEVVRLDAPQQAMRRIATTDTELGGRAVAAGDYVWLVFGSANLDPAAFDRAAELDPGRSPNRHLGFGRGIHQCIGAPLARLELRVALEELLASTASFTVDGEVVRAAWPRMGVERLPLRFS